MFNPFDPEFAAAGAGFGDPRVERMRHWREKWERGPWGHGGPEFGPGFGRGFGPGFGPNFWGRFGRGPRGPQMFGRGDLKFVLLELIKDQPKHGYEMIKDLEARAGGFYTPSAGAIYPTLQLLEDRGWVTSQTVEGKKVYTITDAGRAALQERGEQPGPGPFPFGEHHHGPHHEHGPRGPFGGHNRPELNDLGMAAFDVARLVRQAVIQSQGDPAKFAELQRIVEQTRAALRQFVGEQGPQGDITPNGPAETV